MLEWIMTKFALRRQNTCWQAIVLPYIWLFESAILSAFSISGCHLGRRSILAELGGQQKNQAAPLYVAALPVDLPDYCSWLHPQSTLHLMLYSLLFKTEMNFWSWLLAQNSKPNKHYCCLDECLMCTIIWDNYWKVGECAYPFFLGLIFHKKQILQPAYQNLRVRVDKSVSAYLDRSVLLFSLLLSWTWHIL